MPLYQACRIYALHSALFFHFRTMTFSFYQLFTSYAKYVQRYFSSVAEDDSDYYYFAESFHDVLLSALRDYGDCIKDKDSTSADLSGGQIQGLIPVLSAAYQEAVEDAELNSEIQSCFYPSRFLSSNPDLLEKMKKQLKNHIDFCCPALEV